MRKGLTELVFILDRSGSMTGLESDTIGGFNSVLRKQKNKRGKSLVSTVLFDSKCDVIHDRVPIRSVRNLTERDYETGGTTALLDAVGGAIHHIRSVHKYIREEDRPEHVLFVITTDGLENSSQRYTESEVKKMVEQQKERGWEFLFLGANIDAVETAAHYGIREDRVANFIPDSMGVEKSFGSIAFAVDSLIDCDTIDDNWNMDVDLDYIMRKLTEQNRR
jgi:uncharacterized protein YegL